MLRRHDVTAEDCDEKRKEEDAGDVRKSAHEHRRGRFVRLDVVIEIELQAARFSAQRSRPRRVRSAAASQKILNACDALLQLGAPVLVLLVSELAIFAIRDDADDRDQNADHDREAAAPDDFQCFVANEIEHQPTVSPPVTSMNISSSVCVRGRAE